MNTVSSAKRSHNILYANINLVLMSEPKPSEYLEALSRTPSFLEYPFSMLNALKNAEQSPKFHPEGSVWNHTLLVVDQAAQRRKESSDPRAFMWAALLHDIGKPSTTAVRNGRITSYNHDAAGAILTEKFLEEFLESEEFIDKVYYLVRYHMQVLYAVKGLPLLDIAGIKENSDAREVMLLCLCDRLGRLGASRETEEEQIKLFLKRYEEED